MREVLDAKRQPLAVGDRVRRSKPFRGAGIEATISSITPAGWINICDFDFSGTRFKVFSPTNRDPRMFERIDSGPDPIEEMFKP